MSDVDLTGAVTHLSLCSGYEGLGIGLRGVFPNLRAFRVLFERICSEKMNTTKEEI